MIRNHVTSTLVLAAFIALTALGTGCADRTLEQRNCDRVNEELVKIQAISGTYVGSLSAGTGAGALGGPVLLEIAPDARLQGSCNATDDVPPAAVRGRVVYGG